MQKFPAKAEKSTRVTEKSASQQMQKFPAKAEKSTRVTEKSTSQQMQKFLAIVMAVISIWLAQVMKAFALPVLRLASIQMAANNSAGGWVSTSEDKNVPSS